MITLEEYFRKPHSPEQAENVATLLGKVNALCEEVAESGGVYVRVIDPDTGSEISGAKGGDGDGGFRTPGSQTGAKNSSHRNGEAVDVYDPGDHLDKWLDAFETGAGGNSKLSQYGLYREAPSATPNWCHLTTRAPGSGRRTFLP